MARPQPVVRFATLAGEDLGHDADAWLAASREAAARGDFAQAIVCLFNHELIQLDGARAIHLGPGRTNSRYLGELPDGDGRTAFRRTISVFDAILYGGRSADAGAFERFQADHEALMQAVVATRAGIGAEASP